MNTCIEYLEQKLLDRGVSEHGLNYISDDVNLNLRKNIIDHYSYLDLSSNRNNLSVEALISFLEKNDPENAEVLQDIIKKSSDNHLQILLDTLLQKEKFKEGKLLSELDRKLSINKNLYSKMHPKYLAEFFFSILSDGYKNIYIESNLDESISAMNQGIVMCHGKKHRQPSIPDYLPKTIDWKTVDIRSSTDPDFIADYTEISTLKNIGLYQYSIDQFCPIGSDINHLFEYIYNNRFILSQNGTMIVLNKYNFLADVAELYYRQKEKIYEFIVFLLTKITLFCGYLNFEIKSSKRTASSSNSSLISDTIYTDLIFYT